MISLMIVRVMQQRVLKMLCLEDWCNKTKMNSNMWFKSKWGMMGLKLLISKGK